MNEIVYVGKHSITFSVPRHAHDTWELVYCTSDGGSFRFEDGELSYGVGEIVVIPPFVPHTNVSSTGFTNIHINMANTTLPFSRPTIIRDDGNESILAVFSGAFYQYYGSSDQRDAILSAYGSLLSSFMLAYQSHSTMSKAVLEISNDILRNYSDPSYALDDYLHTMPYSYDYLRKLFQKEIGMTPHQFLSDKRLQTAANMLCSVYNEGNITEVARQCGFREPLYFSRMFKKRYGISPRSYYLEKRKPAAQPSHDSDSMKIMLDDEDED